MERPAASIAIQVLPQVQGEEVLRIVDAVIAHIAASGLRYDVGPFETTVEGDFDTLWALAGQCQRLCVEQGAGSVITYVKSFYNPADGVWSMEEKTAKHRQ